MNDVENRYPVETGSNGEKGRFGEAPLTYLRKFEKIAHTII
jgi:hypothetical protein